MLPSIWERGFFSGLKRKPFLINSCRGEVVETQAVKPRLKVAKSLDLFAIAGKMSQTLIWNY